MAETEEKKGLTPEEIDAVFSGPAPLANRFVATLHPSGVRMAFAEQIVTGGNSFFRTAVVLNYSDAIDLYKVLQTLLQNVEAEIKKSPEPEETPNGQAS